MPMVMAGFDSIGQKPEPVKTVCLDPFFAFVLPMVVSGWTEEEAQAMLLLIAVPMRNALTSQLGAQLDPGARNMTDI